tara:strand:- start:19102 stop:19989 length:888 start_codon:yes stop_codon:yes gene_type:complete
MELRSKLGALLLFLTAISCTSEQKSDAYGQFEVDATTISSEVSGKLVSFEVEEGKTLVANEVAGFVDTVQSYLQKQELKATRASIKTKIGTIEAQKNVFEAQLVTAKKELSRLEALMKEKASTQQQIDNASGQVTSLEKQIRASEVQKKSVFAEIEMVNAKLDQINDKIHRAVIVNPINGIVLNKFVEQHELIGAGKPLFEIANIDEMILRVYVEGGQLPNIKLGQEVEVLIDETETTNQSLRGVVSWISSEAEFTPKMIQTKEERVTQVYAVKVKVLNLNGLIKIGMPGEVNFN